MYTYHGLNYTINHHSIIPSFIQSFNHSLYHSIIPSFIQSFLHSFNHSIIHSIIPSFIISFHHSLYHSIIPSFILSFHQSIIQYIIPSFNHSIIHYIIPSFIISFHHSIIPSFILSFHHSFYHSIIHSIIPSYINITTCSTRNCLSWYTITISSVDIYSLYYESLGDYGKYIAGFLALLTYISIQTNQTLEQTSSITYPDKPDIRTNLNYNLSMLADSHVWQWLSSSNSLG